MKELKNVENIGMSCGKDYEFYSGTPVFVSTDDELFVAINNGSNLVSTTIPVQCLDNVIIEVLNPSFRRFDSGLEGAVYRTKEGDKEVLLNVTYDGVELAKADIPCVYYPFDTDYEDLEELAEDMELEVPVLLGALGF